MENKKTTISLSIKTWNKEWVNFYTSESADQVLKTQSSVRIILHNDSVQLWKDYRNKNKYIEGVQTLGYLLEREGTFFMSRKSGLSCPKIQEGKNKLWLAVNSLKTYKKQYGYLLKTNDIIKLGSSTWRIRQLGRKNNGEDDVIEIPSLNEELPSQNYNQGEQENLALFREYKIHTMEEDPDVTCRICLYHENTPENRLVSPCGCSGSTKYVHISCLKKWIKRNCETKTHKLYTEYSWKDLRCELCHKNYPSIFTDNDRHEDLIDIPDQQVNSIILESLASKDEFTKTIYSISVPSKSAFKIGRGQEMDLSIDDHTLSRFHASVSYSYGDFFLHDSDSKYGTFVLIKGEMPLYPDQKPAIQTGRILISFSVEPTKTEQPMLNIPNPVSKQMEIEGDVHLPIKQPFIPKNTTIQNPFTQRPPSLPQAFGGRLFNNSLPGRVHIGNVFDFNIFKLNKGQNLPKIFDPSNLSLLPFPVLHFGSNQNIQPRTKKNTIQNELIDLGIHDD